MQNAFAFLAPLWISERAGHCRLPQVCWLQWLLGDCRFDQSCRPSCFLQTRHDAALELVSNVRDLEVTVDGKTCAIGGKESCACCACCACSQFSFDDSFTCNSSPSTTRFHPFPFISIHVHSSSFMSMDLHESPFVKAIFADEAKTLQFAGHLRGSPMESMEAEAEEPAPSTPVRRPSKLGMDITPPRCVRPKLTVLEDGRGSSRCGAASGFA
eukprot:Skav215204  [mRNA]  locus=scaffold2331:138007:141026:- [translate_table: standard]